MRMIFAALCAAMMLLCCAGFTGPAERTEA